MKKRCHDLETFGRKTAELNARWVAKTSELPSPIEELLLWSDQGRLEITAVVVRGSGESREIIHGDYPKTTLPLEDELDELLEAFRETRGIEAEDLDWGDYFRLPESLYRMEMIESAHAVVDRLNKRKMAIAPSVRAGILIEDEEYTNASAFARSARKELAKFPRKSAIEFLALYYSRPDLALARIENRAGTRP